MPKHRHVDNSRVWWDNNPGGGQAVSYSSSTNFKVDGNTIYTGYVGGGGNVYCPTFLQLLYVVQNRLITSSLLGVI